MGRRISPRERYFEVGPPASPPNRGQGGVRVRDLTNADRGIFASEWTRFGRAKIQHDEEFDIHKLGTRRLVTGAASGELGPPTFAVNSAGIGAAVFLLSVAASFCTGVDLVVDCGSPAGGAAVPAVPSRGAQRRE